jgi:hypothetical protein
VVFLDPGEYIIVLDTGWITIDETIYRLALVSANAMRLDYG